MKDGMSKWLVEFPKRVSRVLKEVRIDLCKLDAKAKTPAQKAKVASLFDKLKNLLDELESSAKAWSKATNEFNNALDKTWALDKKVKAELKKIGSSKPKAKKAKAKKTSKK